MYTKYLNQNGIAPLVLIIVTFLIISTIGLGISLNVAGSSIGLGGEEGDRSFEPSSISGSIGKLFRGITGAEETNTSGSPNHKRLTLGDGKYSGSPQKGFIYTCRRNYDPNEGGALTPGSWINQNNKTWDLTQKAYVDGSISWPNANWTVTADGKTRKLSGNGLPVNHPTGIYPVKSSDDAYQYDKNPNTITQQTFNLSIPANPTKLGIPECVGGEVGIMLSGVPIFNGFDAGGRDAVAWEVQDGCAGHPQNSGLYHYHGPSSCLPDKTGAEEHSSLLGYAFDGFGIYGVKGAGGIELSTAKLDECHGHSHVINWDGKDVEMYHYHLTNDFPYSVGCFRGKSTVSSPLGKDNGLSQTAQTNQNTSTESPQ